MNKRFVKCISVLLSFAMFFQIAEPALAMLIEDDAFIETEEIPIGMTGETGDVLVLKDAEGNETTVDESWEEVYPFAMPPRSMAISFSSKRTLCSSAS